MVNEIKALGITLLILIGIAIGIFFLAIPVACYNLFIHHSSDHVTSKELPECYDSEIVNKRIPTFLASELIREGHAVNSSQIKITRPVELESGKNYLGEVIFRACEGHMAVKGSEGTFHGNIKYDLELDSNQKSRLHIRYFKELN